MEIIILLIKKDYIYNIYKMIFLFYFVKPLKNFLKKN